LSIRSDRGNKNLEMKKAAEESGLSF